MEPDNATSKVCSEHETISKLSVLLRPPIRSEEAAIAAPHIHNIINTAYDVYKSKGTKGLRQFISDQKLHDDNNHKQVRDGEESHGKDAKITGDPRPYQMALAEIAKEGNTIVQLDTGLGKTLIAIMTIRNFAQDYKNISVRGHPMQTWFLVPSVALAVQQSHTLRANLPYSITTVCHTAANSDEARSKFSKSNILVLTHGSALELLQHYNDVFYFSRMNLIVVDECHHATKKHNYTHIFEQFYHKLSPEDLKPRVLGLTATPIINIDRNFTEIDLEEKLVQLESTLDSKIVGSSSLDMSLEESGTICHKRTEHSIYYENVSIGSNDYPSYENINLHESRKKELKQLFYVLEEYGPAVVFHYTKVLIREISCDMFKKEKPEQFTLLKVYLQEVSTHCENLTSSTSGKTKKFVELEKLLQKHYHGGNGSNEEKCYEDTVGIVFVKQRISALCLKHYFNSVPLNEAEEHDSEHDSERTNRIRSGLLTRKTTHVFKYLSSTQKMSADLQKNAHEDWLHKGENIREVLKDLRSREINLLFATSVVEEGVDIDACSFVIVLDEIQTTKSYIQMRGRARQLDAKFYVFENTCTSSKKNPLSLNDASKIESQVSKYLGSQKRKNFQIETPDCFELIDDGTRLANTGLSKAEQEALIQGLYQAKNGIGIVDLRSSKSLVNRYCSCIPMDIHARSSRSAMGPFLPIYQNTTLTLPSHLPSNIRNIVLPKVFQTGSKRKNENLLALIACVRLHENDVLNERLLPLKRSDIQKKLQAYVLKTFKRVAIDKYSITPNEEDSSYQVFIYPLLQTGTVFQQNEKILNPGDRALCIISMRELPGICDFSLDFAHEQLGKVSCSLGTCKTRNISKSHWDLCCKFYTILMNCRWCRRTGHQYFEYTGNEESSIHTPFIVSCVNGQNYLDWDHMSTVVNDYARNQTKREKSVQDWKGATPRLIAPVYDPNSTYIAMQLDETKLCTAPFPDKEYSSYSDFYAKKWSYKVDDHSKLIQVQRCWKLPTKSSYFANKNSKSSPSPQNYDCNDYFDIGKFCTGLTPIAYLPQNACLEIPMADPCMHLHSILLPQILYELERIQTIHGFLDHCTRWPKLTKNLHTIPLKDITIAMTAKSCVCGQDYERLEYLGDAVLKVIHTDTLINSNNEEFRKWFHCLHEGDFSELRNAMGCNKRLKEFAECAGFDHYILTSPLGRGTWLPFGLTKRSKTSNSERMATNSSLASGKIIADVVESLLGLIYLKCGFKAAVEVAEELEISPMRSSDTLHQLNPPEIATIDEGLINIVSELLCVDKFTDNAFVMEACTHPTKTNLSNYQRLEWIGDAALCLAAREFVFYNFPDLDVKDLVTIETILVCNETLSLIAFNAGLHRHIIHGDSTLPRRLEAYKFQITDEKKGLWSSDPPKVLADVTEALIGVAHIEGGINDSKKVSRNILGNMVEAINEHISQRDDKNTLLMQIKHPIQALSEICSSLKIRSCNTNDFYHNFKAPIWLGRCWENCSENSNAHGSVGHIHFHDLSLCAIFDKNSRSVAKMKASSLLYLVLGKSKDLQHKLEEMSVALGEK